MAHFKPNTKSKRAAAYSYAADRSPSSIQYLREYWIDEPGAEVDDRGNTLLHSLVICGNKEALEELIGLVTIQELKKQNSRGDTALHEAARVGEAEMARTLLGRKGQLASDLMPYYPALVTRDVDMEAAEEESGGLASVQNQMGETPLYVAVAAGHKKVFEFLKNHSDCNTQRKDGCTILHAAIIGEYYHLAINIFRAYPQLAHKADTNGNTPLNLLAASPSSFRSASMYAFQYLGRKPFIPLQFIVILLYYCVPPTHYINSEEEPQKKKRNIFVQKILEFPWFKPIDDAKQMHILADELAKRLIEHEADWGYYSNTEYTTEHTHNNISVVKKNKIPNPLIQAIENSIPELVHLILHKCPDSANCIDEKGRNVLHIAAEYKSIIIYERLKRHVVNKERMLAEVDHEGNTILHHTVTNLDTSSYISVGIFYIMCWNVFWFQRIRRDCPPYMRHLQNKKGESAEKLFITKSQSGRENAAKAMRDITGNLMVVSALIGTISFAALFTIPGSYDQKHGYPLLLKTYKRDVELFLGYDATTLFASTFALGNLLSIQMSRFNVDSFLIALPLKYLIAIGAMYYSACFTVATTLQAFILEECLPKYYMGFVSCIAVILGLGYIDAAYYVFFYLIYFFEYSFQYKTQER